MISVARTHLSLDYQCGIRRIKLVFIAFFLICSGVISFSEHSIAERQVSEYDLKLVYLYNFTKFVAWPEAEDLSRAKTFNICIDGTLPSSATLAQLRAKATNGRRINVMALNQMASAAHCHILFFRNRTDQNIDKVLQSIGGSAVLTVGELDGFATSGGMIEFSVNAQNRLELEINLSQVRSGGLHISAQLLEIATHVHQDKQT